MIQYGSCAIVRPPVLIVSSLSPKIQPAGYVRGAGVATLDPAGEELIVRGVPMPDVGLDGQIEGDRIEPGGGGRAPDAARILPVRVVGDGPALRLGATGKRIAQALREPGHVALVELLPALGGPLPRALARVGIGQTFPL